MDPQPIFMALRKNSNTFLVDIDMDSWSGAPDRSSHVVTQEGVNQLRAALDNDYDYIRFVDADGMEFAIRRTLIRVIGVKPA